MDWKRTAEPKNPKAWTANGWQSIEFNGLDRNRLPLADLRFLQGYFETVGRETEDAALEEPDERLAELAARKAKEQARIGDEIEAALGETCA